MNKARVSIRRKLIFATLAPLCAAIILCWMIGAVLITDRIFSQAQKKVIGDLNSARKVYLDEISHLAGIVKVAGLSPEMSASLEAGRFAALERVLQQLLQSEQLSFLNVIDADGVVRYRAANPQVKGDLLDKDPLVAKALQGETAGGSQLYTSERLGREHTAFAKGVATTIRITPHSRPTSRMAEERGLVLVAVAPLRAVDGTVVGALQAGLMLNGDSRLVDTITRIVFDKEEGGAATVFLGDVRIATSVRDTAGERATGTLMSGEVASAVLDNGERWSSRAFVLNDWNISAYEPISDPQGKVIGALYVGMSERPFLQMRTNLNLTFIGVLLFVALIGVTISTWISTRLAEPVRALAEGARRIAAGEHIPPIDVHTDDEIALLADEFNTMNREVSTLKRTLEQKVMERTFQLEDKNRELLNAQKELAKAERLAGLGLLAAGVAHEINNPLAIIRGNTELLQDEIPVEALEREEVEAIMVEVGRIERIVSNLRVFSKRETLLPHPFELERLLDGILNQIGHQIPLERYCIERSYSGCGIVVTGDEERLRQVFTNLILNGLQAMPEGGRLAVAAEEIEAGRLVSVTVSDNGSGIRPEHIEKLFTPFFTTKARGTGLGLAVSYGIVSDHGGEIRAASQEGQGATFTVLLPLMEDAAPDSSTVQAA
ncbi:MAG: hypothetical protein A2X79_01765 [Desulfuromonadaceae bacterium GWB2_53_15]|nr:MAG: hypothetical protein A2X83_01800 [Desulfuromonadales bacterium GWD2_54_10]OHB26827.1 MAG: hypothetical protein A2X79_01765 [Desulfuromonadaceae bacterium GWB2_53_15]